MSKGKFILFAVIFAIMFLGNHCNVYAKYVLENRNEAFVIKHADTEKPAINGRNYDVLDEKLSGDVIVEFNDNLGIGSAKYWYNAAEKVFDDSNVSNLESGTTFNKGGFYKIEVSDLYGNITTYTFTIESEFNEVILETTDVNDTGSRFKITATDYYPGVQRIELYIAGNLFKTFTYDEWFVQSRVEEFDVNIVDLPFYGETYAKAFDFYGSFKISKVCTPNKTRIYDNEDLLKFRDLINKNKNYFNNVTIYLLNNLDLSNICSEKLGNWIPLNNFAGTFEGNNHTISNFYINNGGTYQALFYRLGGKLQNLKIDGQILNGDFYSAGFVAISESTAVIENCVNNVTISTGSQKERVAGIVAFNQGYVNNCLNNANISSYTNVGGIVGYNNFGHIEYCCNKAQIIGENRLVGGICGYTTDYKNGTLDSIRFCYNEGDISGKDYVGGICGGAWNESGTTTKMSDLYNTGTVTITTNYGTGGGILGATYYNFKGVTSENSNIINYVYNIGDVNGSKINQIASGYFNFKNAYYISGKQNNSNLGIAKDSNLFKAPLSNSNSVLYGLNQSGANIWTINSRFNNGNVILKWQLEKNW